MSILDQYEEKILWEAQPSGLWQRLLTKLHLNFTHYQITKDELAAEEIVDEILKLL